MNRADYLTLAQGAGSYMQTFVRERKEDFHDLAINSKHRRGWLGAGVDEAHDVAMFLWQYTEEHFLNCRIPEDYGSPELLLQALTTLSKFLQRDRDKLQAIIEAEEQDNIAETVWMVSKRVIDTMSAAEEALAQIKHATSEFSGSNPLVGVAAPPSPIERIQSIADHFAAVVACTKKRRKDRDAIVIEDEYDVQYLFEALLAVQFSDIRPEEPTPSVAGGAGRADTFLKLERIVVEYKCTRRGLGAKELRKQIADDFLLYGSHTGCDRLFVFVYDLAQHISNPMGFEEDLTRKIDGLSEVRIVIRR